MSKINDCCSTVHELALRIEDTIELTIGGDDPISDCPSDMDMDVWNNLLRIHTLAQGIAWDSWIQDTKRI